MIYSVQMEDNHYNNKITNKAPAAIYFILGSFQLKMKIKEHIHTFSLNNPVKV